VAFGIASIALLAAAVNAVSAPSAENPGQKPGVDQALRIAVLGDSLAAGYGLTAEEAFPAQLERALLNHGIRAEVLNHGVSGDTSSGGRRRVQWMLRDRPRVVLLELGANDALRGLNPEQLEENLDAILTALGSAGVVPVLAGMRAPRNLGDEYTESFDAVFPRLAKRHKVALYPFFLEGVAGDPALNQADGLHPNSAGVQRIVQGILPLIEAAVNSIRGTDQ